jgi:protein tyrosine phosphatase (PTP) superfamily phosphohydrolase (DUF442 family)
VISKLLVAQVGALLLSSAVFISARAHQADKATLSPFTHPMGTRQQIAGIPNFAEVTPHLYRGGQPGIQGMNALKKMGIDVIVNMRGGNNRDERAIAQKLGMQYVSIPWHCPLPRDKPFVRFLKLIEENPGKKFFVHCRLGNDRTGMAVAAYRMAEEGWSAEEAMNEMKAFGFSRMHHWICPALAPYERSFPDRLKTSPAFKDLHGTRAK